MLAGVCALAGVATSQLPPLFVVTEVVKLVEAVLLATEKPCAAGVEPPCMALNVRADGETEIIGVTIVPLNTRVTDCELMSLVCRV